MGLIRLTRTVSDRERKTKMNNVLIGIMNIIRAATYPAFMDATRTLLDICRDNPGKQVTQTGAMNLTKKSITQLKELRNATNNQRKRVLDNIRDDYSKVADKIVAMIDDLANPEEMIYFPHAQVIKDLKGEGYALFSHDIIFLTANNIRVADIPKDIKTYKIASGRLTNELAFANQKILALPTDDKDAAQEIIQEINTEHGTDYVNIGDNGSRSTPFFSYRGSSLYYAWLIDGSVSSKLKLMPKVIQFADDESSATNNTDMLRKQRIAFEKFVKEDDKIISLQQEKDAAKRLQMIKKKGVALSRTVTQIDKDIEVRKDYLLDLFSGRSSMDLD